MACEDDQKFSAFNLFGGRNSNAFVEMCGVRGIGTPSRSEDQPEVGGVYDCLVEVHNPLSQSETVDCLQQVVNAPGGNEATGQVPMWS